jgi:mRNA interferase MazF
VPERADIVRIVLDLRVGREHFGERPALVLSVKAFNELTGYAFVAPVTSKRRDWPFEVPVPDNERISGVVLADQTKSIDYVARHIQFIAKAPAGLVEAVLEKVSIILTG